MSFLTSARPIARRAAQTPISNILSQQQQSRAVSKFTVVGRLAATPELVTTATGRELVRYALGTNTGYGENRVTSWWKVAAFPPEGSVRENLLSLGKGTLVYVEEEASMRKFERDGRTESGLSLVQSE